MEAIRTSGISYPSLISTIVVQLEKVGTVPVGDIVCDCGFLEAGIELRVLHKEEPIKFVVNEKLLVGKPLFLFGRDGIPASVSVTPLASVVFFSPRVSHSDELSSILKYMNADQTVHMTQVEAICSLRAITKTVNTTWSVSLYNGVLAILREEFSVERIWGRTIIVHNLLEGSSSKGSESRIGIATIQVLVVTMELCQSFLDQRPP